MTETLAFMALGAGLYGMGWLQGFLTGECRALRRQTEWLRKSNDLSQKLQTELQAFFLEREDYHRSIVAWIRGKERA